MQHVMKEEKKKYVDAETAAALLKNSGSLEWTLFRGNFRMDVNLDWNL